MSERHPRWVPCPWRWRLRVELLALTRFVGFRDRLRCPKCKAVGTYKPHGFWFTGGDRQVPRVLCKFCGYYRGPEGELTAGINGEAKEWQLLEWGEIDELITPQRLLRKAADEVGVGANPWFG